MLRKIFSRVVCSTGNSRVVNRFSTSGSPFRAPARHRLTRSNPPSALRASMFKIGRLALAVVTLALGVVPARAETVTLFRVFLNDGTAVVSYGEYARVGDRVVFSMPLGLVSIDTAKQPALHVMNLPAAAIDWTATAKYAEAARFAHYVATTAE